MKDVYNETVERMHSIRTKFYGMSSNVIIDEVWEHEVREQLKENEEMMSYFDSHHDTSPFLPRDTLYGGTKKYFLTPIFRSYWSILFVRKSRR